MNQRDPVLAAEQLREHLLGRLVTTLSQFLACELEDLVTDRADHAVGERACPLGQSAEAAQRIAWHCRQLQTQVARFERFNRMTYEAEADRARNTGTGESDLPF
jgi:hypothetical protein